MVAAEERQEGAYGKHRRVADHPPHNSNLEPAGGRTGAELVPEAAERAF